MRARLCTRVRREPTVAMIPSTFIFFADTFELPGFDSNPRRDFCKIHITNASYLNRRSVDEEHIAINSCGFGEKLNNKHTRDELCL